MIIFSRFDWKIEPCLAVSSANMRRPQRIASWKQTRKNAIYRWREGRGEAGLDFVYIVNDTLAMPTIVQSCRIEEGHAALLSRQAKRRHLEVSTLSSLYLKEKALEEEFPGIGFRDSIGGREAYVQGHRIAVWEVVEVHREAKTIARTADHFRWTPALVRCALAYARAFAKEIAQQREAEAAG